MLCDIGNIQVATLLIDDLCIRGCLTDTVQDGLGVGCRWIAVVVTQDNACIVGVGAYYCNCHILLKRQKAVLVLEQNDSLVGCLAGKSGVGGAAQVIETKVCPGQILGGIEHTQLKTGLEDTANVYVDIGLGDETLLDSL